MNSCKKIISLMLFAVLFAGVSLSPNAYSKESPKAKEVQSISVVDINSAEAEELQIIKGIGPKLAARIVQYRVENGKFKNVDDIMNVRGVGTAKFSKIKSCLKV